MSSLAYTHPSTHPASMITGLSEYLTSSGYGKCATGSYSGTGSYTEQLNRKIILPFSPSIILITSNHHNTGDYSPELSVIAIAQGCKYYTHPSNYVVETANLQDNILTVGNVTISTSEQLNLDDGGIIYYWAIFA